MSKILFLLVIILLSVSTAFAQTEGFTVTSVTTSSVVSKTTDPSTVFWIINTQLNGGGQSLTGTITPDDIKDKTNGKVYTKTPLSIEVNSLKEDVFYEVENEGIPVYVYTGSYNDAPTGLFDVIIDNAPQCSSGTDYSIPAGESFFGKVKRRFCINATQVGVKGVFKNPVIGFNAKVKISTGEDTKERIVCSGSTTGCDGSSVTFGDVGVVQWTGSLVTGESPPNQDNFVAVKRFFSIFV
ncbi:MAG: hypothetical protein HY831_02320 [Candidatus Aenigmarchaeota archaeon]|nr:hypothetical protein [Candidatus Aenigmarchaeota archaeon]